MDDDQARDVTAARLSLASGEAEALTSWTV
jgi:hypothetical protein